MYYNIIQFAICPTAQEDCPAIDQEAEAKLTMYCTTQPAQHHTIVHFEQADSLRDQFIL